MESEKTLICEEEKDTKYGVTSFIFGILAIVNIGWLPCGILGLVFGIMQRKKEKRDPFATAGTVLSVIALIKGLLTLLAVLAMVSLYLLSMIYMAYMIVNNGGM